MSHTANLRAGKVRSNIQLLDERSLSLEQQKVIGRSVGVTGWVLTIASLEIPIQRRAEQQLPSVRLLFGDLVRFETERGCL